MAGTFSVGESKTRPGVYHRRYSVGGGEVAGALNGVGMGIIRANWGPLNRAVAFEPSTNVNAVFGSGNTEDLITEMFSGGISSGYFVRCGTGGTAPTITLKDNAKADVVTITGAYVGDRAFSVSVRDSLTGDGRECIIYEGTTEFLKVTFEADTKEPAGLAAAINAATKDFVAKATAAGSGVMATVTQSAMTKGTQPTAAVSEYSAALDAFDAVRGNVICVDTDDAAVHSLVQAYITRTFTGGSYPMGCVAENKGVEFDTRTTHAAAFNDEKMHYCVNGALNATGDDYNGYKLAARIGGMIASVASNVSLTHTVVKGFVDLDEGLTNSQIEKALKRGCIVLTKNASGQVQIEQGINTLVSPDGNMDAGWKKIRRTKERFELMQRIDDSLDPIVGKLDNDSDGRATVIAMGKAIIAAMVGEKKLTSGDMYEDESNPPQGDSAWFILDIVDKDSLEHVYLAYKYRFATEVSK